MKLPSLKNQEFFYKVVNYQLQSCRAWDWPYEYRKEFCIQYVIGQPTFPIYKGSKIFIFETLEQAKTFASYRHTDKIFKCKATNPRRSKYCGNFYEQIKILWLTKKKVGASLKNFFGAPQGTVWADSITLIEEVK